MKKTAIAWTFLFFAGFGNSVLAEAPKPDLSSETRRESFLQLVPNSGIHLQKSPHAKKISGTINRSLKPGTSRDLKK